MLHVFNVDTGIMMKLDMSLTMESVDNLKHHVEKEYEIPVSNQVLLISGGECLDPKKRVCSYSAGTDTNPIYLFNKKIIIESSNEPGKISKEKDATENEKIPSKEVKNVVSKEKILIKELDATEIEIIQQVISHCKLPITFETVSKRTDLARALLDSARKQMNFCDTNIHEQHLQQQGWSAVLANLDDVVNELRVRSGIFQKLFNEYLEKRESYLVLLGNYKNNIELLKRIPVIPVLMKQLASIEYSSKAKQKVEEEKEEASENKDTPETSVANKKLSLFDWISASDDKNTLDQLYTHCFRGLIKFDHEFLQKFLKESEAAFQCANNPSFKEVKGMEERLSGLESVMRDIKKLVKQQAELAHSFEKNQKQANCTKDSSVLPDLCLSHIKQLEMMSTNYSQICELQRRCLKSKDEMCTVLHTRLTNWVIPTENKIQEIDQKLIIYHENLNRLKLHLEVLHQIHVAPTTYLNAVAEVVRRRSFSQHFLVWASELACHLFTIHNDEVTRRKEFQSQFKGHFLNSLFPGMEDLPSNFATQAPAMFDTALLEITHKDIDKLKRELPDLADNLKVADISALTNLIISWSLPAKKDGELQEMKIESDQVMAVDDKLIQAVNDVGLASDLDRDILRVTSNEPCLTTASGLPFLKDLDKGCESETDTEEFEKVGQSPLELNFDKNIPSPRTDEAQDVSTSTEDNLQISRGEHDKIKTFLGKIFQLAREATVQLKSELSEMRLQILASRDSTSQQCDSLTSYWNNLIVLRDTQEKITLDNAMKDNENVINTLKKENDFKSKEIEDLLSEKSSLDNTISKSREELTEMKQKFEEVVEENRKIVENLRKELQEKDTECEKIVKETSDRLNRDHKAEMESIRSRFRLMTMERSHSDASLEKSTDPNSAPNIVLQIKQCFEVEKEKAVHDAVLKEREEWEKLLDVKIKELKNNYVQEKDLSLQNLAKVISEEKDKQIDVLMEREKNLTLECLKHKSTIQQLTESESERSDEELLKKITALQDERDNLLSELNKTRREKDALLDMSASVGVCEANVDAATNPMMKHKDTKKGDSPKGMLSVDSCKPGERVIVMWDKEHENYRVVQEKQHLYFLHSDYLEGLGLEIIEGEPNKQYSIGDVLDKEYCVAKKVKSDNRYKVPKSTKFFRVKVRPSTAVNPRDISQSLIQSSNVAESSRMVQSTNPCGSKETLSEYMLRQVLSSFSGTTTSETHEVEFAETDELESLPLVQDSEATLTDTDAGQPTVHEAVEAQEAKKHFAEDSGIVDNMDSLKNAMASCDASESENRDNGGENIIRNEDDDMQCEVDKTHDDPFLVV